MSQRFELRDLTLVRRVETEGSRTTGVTVEDPRTGVSSFVEADVVVVAADAFRSPQLLWASGVRPAALNRIPFSEPGHPFSVQAMYSETTPFPMPADAPFSKNRWGYVNMGYGMRKHPRFEDGVTFDDKDPDYRGFPNMTVSYALTERENAEIEDATAIWLSAGTR